MRTMKSFVIVAGAVLVSTAAFAGGMKPGLWEITSKNEMGGAGRPTMPAIPADQLAKMKEMGINMPVMADGQGVTVRNCITKEQAEKGVPPAQGDNDRTRCEQKEVKQEGDKVSWRFECTGEHPATGTGSVVFEGPERYSGTSTIVTKDPRQGQMTMTSSFSGKWLSDSCR